MIAILSKLDIQIYRKNFHPDLEKNSCGEGFELIPGDIPGDGVLGRVKVGDTDECAELCLNNNQCRSYEYSVTEKWCNLNRELKPTEPVYGDYFFCSLKGT